MSKWKNATSFSRGETDRTPKTWEREIRPFRLVVTRHIYYPPDTWLAACDGVFHYRELESKDIDEAKSEAEAILRSALEDALRDLQKDGEACCGSSGTNGRKPDTADRR